MNKLTKIIILAVIAIVAFIALCVSQTFPRDSLSHYLAWSAAFLAGVYAGFFLFQHCAKE